MYFTTHLSCGLFCGALTKNSLGALCLGLVSHAALDMIPHHDYDSVGGAAVDIASGLVILSAMQTLFPGLSGPAPLGGHWRDYTRSRGGFEANLSRVQAQAPFPKPQRTSTPSSEGVPQRRTCAVCHHRCLSVFLL